MPKHKRLETVVRCGACGACSYYYIYNALPSNENREEHRAHQQCMQAHHWTHQKTIKTPVLAYQNKYPDVRVTP